MKNYTLPIKVRWQHYWTMSHRKIDGGKTVDEFSTFIYTSIGLRLLFAIAVFALIALGIVYLTKRLKDRDKH